MSENNKVKKSDKVKIELKLKRRHPLNTMRLGRHSIINDFREYELDEKEVKYLKSEGGLHWFIDRKSFEALQAKKVK